MELLVSAGFTETVLQLASIAFVVVGGPLIIGAIALGGGKL
jgi:hypothetical protein